MRWWTSTCRRHHSHSNIWRCLSRRRATQIRLRATSDHLTGEAAAAYISEKYAALHPEFALPTSRHTIGDWSPGCPHTLGIPPWNAETHTPHPQPWTRSNLPTDTNSLFKTRCKSLHFLSLIIKVNTEVPSVLLVLAQTAPIIHPHLPFFLRFLCP